MENESEKSLKYIPVGDSYTIGTGVDEIYSFPAQLIQKLKGAKIHAELVTNPAREGYTTRDLIKKELSVLRKNKPDFSTLLIGVNDWIQNISEVEYKENLTYIIDQMQESIARSDNIVLITSPDFSVTPKGPDYAEGRNISDGINKLNSFMKEEAEKRSLPLVDIFPVSQNMEVQPSHIAKDGLHPNGKEYQQWVSMLFPVVKKMLSR